MRFARRSPLPLVVQNTILSPLKNTTKSPKMNTYNQIKNILNARGFKHVVPNDDFLQKAGITLHRFNKIVENKVKMTLDEATTFSNWLGVSLEELTEASPIEA